MYIYMCIYIGISFDGTKNMMMMVMMIIFSHSYHASLIVFFDFHNNCTCFKKRFWKLRWRCYAACQDHDLVSGQL